MKASKTKNLFQTGFQQSKAGLPKIQHEHLYKVLL